MARDDDYSRDDLYLFDDFDDPEEIDAEAGIARRPGRAGPGRMALGLATALGAAALAWFLFQPGAGGPAPGDARYAAEAPLNGTPPSGVVRAVGGGSVLAPLISR